MVAGFKYFHMTGAATITVRTRGTARGTLFVRTAPDGAPIAQLAVQPSRDWTAATAALTPTGGDQALYLCYQGRGRLDLLDFTLD